MEEIRTVKRYLDDIFRCIEEDVRKDKYIQALIGDEKNLRKFIDSQKEIIKRYLESWKEDSVKTSEELERLYTSLEIPATAVFWGIERIKFKIVDKLISEKYSTEFLLNLKKHLQNLLDQVAKIYLHKEIRDLSFFEESPFVGKLLYKAHIDWLKEIREAILNDNLSKFPVISAEECPFTDFLEFPESIFVCIDANMCTYIHDLHSIIHDTANTFYTFYAKGSYYQAYKVFKDLQELISKFLKTISELYFLAYSDTEANFFKFVHTISSLEGYKYVSLIDIANLGRINKTYGEHIGDQIVNSVWRKLKEFMEKDKERTLIIRGVTSNFFMLNTDYSEREIRELTEKLARELSFEFVQNGKKIDVSVVISTLELEPYMEISESDIRDILVYLKGEAKEKHQKTAISIGIVDRERLLMLINEKYRNIERIKNKIEKGEIELVFQPIVKVDNIREIEGVEVLVRLVYEDKLVPAGVFIDLIYELDLIDKLDSHILKKIAEYKDGLKRVTNTLFINVSPRSLLSNKFVDELCDFIKCNEDMNLIFELTEQSFLENIDILKRLTGNTKAKFAVDDFGSGYSSLKIVSELADREVLTSLKIDGSLIKDINTSRTIRKVVDVISDMCRKLNLKCIAEFIENNEILKSIRELRIPLAQGFYIAKPMLLPELLAWAKNKNQNSKLPKKRGNEIYT